MLFRSIVVTGVTQTNANSVKLNPKTTLQPLPAGDGADLLQSVANMSVIRKGGEVLEIRSLEDWGDLV